MKIFLGFLLAATTLSFGPTDTHKFYVGLTQIDYSEPSRTYQVSIKLFSDDLENALKGRFGEQVRVLNGTHAPTDTLIYSYLDAHFGLSEAEAQEWLLVPIGTETKAGVTWIYLESAEMPAQPGITVFNELLMELFDDQRHIVHFNQLGQKSSALLHRDKRRETLQL